MSRALLVAVAAGASVCLPVVAVGADIAKSPQGPSAGEPPSNWSGLYLGANASAGALFGNYDAGAVAVGGMRFRGFGTGFGYDEPDTPVLFGGQIGRNWQFDQLVVGVEADLDATGLRRSTDISGLPVAAASGLDLFRASTPWTGSLRARAGIAYQSFLVYGTAGLALADVAATVQDTGTGLIFGDRRLALGGTAGAGVEAMISGNWSLGVEYRYSEYGREPYGLGGLAADIGFRSHEVTARLNWWPWNTPEPKGDGAGDKGGKNEGEADSDKKVEAKDWSIHGQSTFVEQGTPGFRSPYVGPNSLLPDEARETWTATAFIGRRLWEGGALFVNPEFDQGFGLSQTLGLGGFSNGEAQKAGAAYPKLHAQRYYLQQTLGFGGEQEPVEDAANKLAGMVDVSRLTVWAGKFSVTDFFDDNKYSHDPRTTFLNWAIWEAGAFDYPADQLGFTYGLAAELNQKDWAVRGGYFLVPKLPNSNELDPQIFERGGAVVEFEGRYALLSAPGKLRVLGFVNRGFSGSYRAALSDVAVDPGLDPTDAIAATRRTRVKYGVVLNLEQAVTAEIGLFSRLSWNNGQSEIMSFTDIDRSLSLGAEIKGRSWGRPNDRIGLAGAINGLSQAHRDYIAAGGLGILIGDGRLDYRPEKILEAYYALSLSEPVTLSFDYQFVADPAYNADRGPASIFALRLHGEF